RIWIVSGSDWLTPTWKPASYPWVFIRWRLTAEGSTRRSATSTPAELRAVIIARLIVRHGGGRWRLTAEGGTRRSATSTPAELRSVIIARLIVRQARGDSRLATTRAPRFSA